MSITAYLAAEGFQAELATELGQGVIEQRGRLFICEGDPLPAAWAANIWYDARTLDFASISEAARLLRALQRNWAHWPTDHFRRASLIIDKLPHVSAKPLTFPTPAPSAPLGSWTLLSPTRLLASPQCSSRMPHGEWHFVEDRSGPPNRAYLKLWEALTRFGRTPQAGETCLDLGASPGGWTWVMARLGLRVVAVDKAPLAPTVAALPNVEWQAGSAFARLPEAEGEVDWLLSDVVCYPARLLGLVERWLARGKVRNIICTVKFQGATDHQIARAFAAIPGGQLIHLHHNKHELCWMWRQGD